MKEISFPVWQNQELQIAFFFYEQSRKIIKLQKSNLVF